jgi:hypothetical protein
MIKQTRIILNKELVTPVRILPRNRLVAAGCAEARAVVAPPEEKRAKKKPSRKTGL